MSLVKYGAFITEMSGKLGTLVYSRNRGGHYVREIGTYTDAASAEQLQLREWFKIAVQFWQNMNSDCQLAWIKHAQQYPRKSNHMRNVTLAGYNSFISAFLNKTIELGYLPNNLVVNGTFSVDANWIKGTGWSISSNSAIKSTSAESLLIQYNYSINLYDFYYFGLEVISLYTGSFLFYYGNTTGTQGMYCSLLGLHSSFSEILSLSAPRFTVSNKSLSTGSITNIFYIACNQFPHNLL